MTLAGSERTLLITPLLIPYLPFLLNYRGYIYHAWLFGKIQERKKFFFWKDAVHWLLIKILTNWTIINSVQLIRGKLSTYFPSQPSFPLTISVIITILLLFFCAIKSCYWVEQRMAQLVSSLAYV